MPNRKDKFQRPSGTSRASVSAALADANQRARATDARYQAIVENAVDAIITIDEDGVIESVNPSGTRLFEYSESELVGQNVSMLVPSPDRERHDEYIRRYLETGKGRIIGIGREVEGVKKSGRRFPMRLSLGHFEIDGRHFFTGIIQDLSERRRYDESVRLIAAIVESSNDAIIGLLPDGTVSSWNNGAERLCGYRADEMLGERIDVILPHNERAAFADCCKRVQRGASLSGIGMILRCNDGSNVPVDLNLAPIHGASGTVVGASMAAHDTARQKQAERELQERAARMEAMNAELQRRRDEAETQRREMEEINSQLMIAMQEAQKAAEAKTQFLANMSHEIRTPMTAILGFVSELAERNNDPEFDSSEAIDVIRRNGSHLLALIDDVLDLSKLESGRLELTRSKFNPMEVAREVMAPFELCARNKRLDFRLQCEADVPTTIESDATRFRQILVNLIDNALKFTEVGRIEVRLGRSTREASAMLNVRVIDTGIGIDDRETARLFAPFSQGDTSMTRAFGGAGLGLSLCAGLVELLGGEIGATGKSGRGSEFWFSIPLGLDAGLDESATDRSGIPPAAIVDGSTAECLKGYHVLLVEDGVDNQRLYRRFLFRAGAEVSLAVNGSDAVSHMLSARESGRVPDIVVMDMQMPVMDGYAATRALRGAGFEVPIVALTAHAMTYDRDRCLEAGCDDYLPKPVDKKTLFAVLSGWLREPGLARAPAADVTKGGRVGVPANRRQSN